MVNQASVILAVLVFLLICIYKHRCKEQIFLDDIVVAVLAAAVVPTAILCILFPFKSELIDQIEGLSVQVAIMGLVLLFVSVRTIWENLEKRSNHKERLTDGNELP